MELYSKNCRDFVCIKLALLPFWKSNEDRRLPYISGLCKVIICLINALRECKVRFVKQRYILSCIAEKDNVKCSLFKSTEEWLWWLRVCSVFYHMSIIVTFFSVGWINMIDHIIQKKEFKITIIVIFTLWSCWATLVCCTHVWEI